MDNEIIGTLTQRVIDEFNLPYKVGEPIYIGDSNREHMRNEHPDDYSKYGDLIEKIINFPDYIAKHPTKENSSIEYIKVIKDKNDEYVLVAVRATGKGKLFVRTLFVMDPKKVERYKSKNAFISYK